MGNNGYIADFHPRSVAETPNSASGFTENSVDTHKVCYAATCVAYEDDLYNTFDCLFQTQSAFQAENDADNSVAAFLAQAFHVEHTTLSASLPSATFQDGGDTPFYYVQEYSKVHAILGVHQADDFYKDALDVYPKFSLHVLLILNGIPLICYLAFYFFNVNFQRIK